MYTFIMLKYDALERELAEAILQRFKKEGFNIEIVGFKKATREIIIAHYEEAFGRIPGLEEKALKDLVDKDFMPIILSSNHENTIEKAREIIGATDPIKAEAGTIRKDFGIDSREKADSENRWLDNLIHSCDSKESYNNEIKIWLGDEIYNQYKY
ncbi:MAG: nucleoside-diphosphate kinase [Oscillospiraceae bacterium]|nr:nucleoside-diphosphate kinase [Oscillospiraceae bacterium]